MIGLRFWCDTSRDLYNKYDDSLHIGRRVRLHVSKSHNDNRMLRRVVLHSPSSFGKMSAWELA